jgi:hypothetical protein
VEEGKREYARSRMVANYCEKATGETTTPWKIEVEIRIRKRRFMQLCLNIEKRGKIGQKYYLCLLTTATRKTYE